MRNPIKPLPLFWDCWVISLPNRPPYLVICPDIETDEEWVTCRVHFPANED